MKKIVVIITLLFAIVILFLFYCSRKPSAPLAIRNCGQSSGLRYSRQGFQDYCQCNKSDETFFDDGSKLGESVNFYCIKNKSLPIKIFSTVTLFPSTQIRHCAETIMSAHPDEHKQMINTCACSNPDESILYSSSAIGKHVDLYCVKKVNLPPPDPNY